MLQVKNISLKLGGLRILEDLSFDIHKGEVVGLIGPNGAGKSTFFNVLSGLIRPDSGSIQYRTHELVNRKPHKISRHGIVRTFQDTRLFSQMTVLENLLISSKFSKRINLYRVFFDRKHIRSERKSIENKAMELLKRVGLEGKAHECVSDLSYGQGKLIEILKVMIAEPRLILLDEPFSGLFPEMIKIIAGLIREMVEQDKTIIIVEHNMKLIDEITDRVIVLDSGKKISEGPFSVVKNEKEVIDAYLGR